MSHTIYSLALFLAATCSGQELQPIAVTSGSVYMKYNDPSKFTETYTAENYKDNSTNNLKRSAKIIEKPEDCFGPNFE